MHRRSSVPRWTLTASRIGRCGWRASDVLAISQPVFDEISDVLSRPGLTRFLDPDLTADLLDQLVSGTVWFEPAVAVTDCCYPTDNKYLELALAAQASVIVSSDFDLLVLNPWHGTLILRPAEYVVPR